MPSSLLRRQQHRHVSTLQPGRDIERGDILDLTEDAVQHLLSKLWMGDFSATEENRDFDPLAPFDKLADIADLIYEVMTVRPGPHLDLLDGYKSLFFLGPVRFFSLFIAELSVIHHAADRRLSFRRHLDQVQLLHLHHLEGLMQRHHP